MLGKYLPFGSIVLIAVAWFLLPLPKISAQVQNGITAPENGDIVAGAVLVQGTAVDINFLRYELAFMNLTRPGSQWIVFAQGDQQVISDTLAVWDTTVGSETNPIYPDGPYELRLRVVRTDYNYNEYFATNLIISNRTPTPTPTTDITATLEFTGTVVPDDVEIPPILVTPDTLPTLTAFPSPTPLATAENQPLGPAQTQDEPEQSSGIFQQLFEIDTSQFGRAFWRGVLIASIVFIALAAYLLARGVFRRFWRAVQRRLLR